MKVINEITLLQLLENAKSNKVEITNVSHSIVNRNVIPRNYRDYVVGLVHGNYTIGLNYGKEINRRLVENGVKKEYKAMARPYGEWIIPNVALEANGEIYIRAYYNNPEDLNVKIQFLGGDIPKDVEERIKRSVTTCNYRQKKAGLKDGQYLLMRMIKPSSIKKIKIDNEEYLVK